jgi:hypothetical protein
LFGRLVRGVGHASIIGRHGHLVKAHQQKSSRSFTHQRTLPKQGLGLSSRVWVQAMSGSEEASNPNKGEGSCRSKSKVQVSGSCPRPCPEEHGLRSMLG